MSTLTILTCVVISIGIVFFAASAPADLNVPILKPTYLRCEYHVNPLGIDVTRPRLSWVLTNDEPEARGQRQTAYQILVATRKDKLNEQQADLWNSGKVLSDETNQIVYNGRELQTGEQCWWTLRTWNGSDRASEWGEPAFWTMGLLDPEDWKAQWIGYDESDPRAEGKLQGDPTVNLDNCTWIWTDIPATTDPAVDEAYFRRTITIFKEQHIRAANIMLTADNSFELFINGVKITQGGELKLAYSANVTNQLHAGRNTLAVKVRNAPGSPAGLVARLRVDYQQGEPLIVETDPSWKVTRTGDEHWREIDFDDAEWKTSKVIATVGEPPFGTPQRRELVLPPPPYLRKTFNTEKEIRKATLYATALGLYEIHINGKRAHDTELVPGWTDFHKRIYYQTYDVTPLLQTGKNAMAAILADGWYEGYLGYTFKRHNYGGEPRLRAQLQIEFNDGSAETVITDDSWRASYGPLREADLLMGCTYDANRELRGWDTAEFDDSSWRPVFSGRHEIALHAHPGAPVKRIEEIPAKKVTEPKPGVLVFDLGQNMVGWCRLRLRGSPEQRITIRYSEMLNPDGTAYTVALRAARATDTYICGTRDSSVTWEPQFTFHGFRYVEITGLSDKPSLDSVTGIVVHSDIQPTGTFECSNPLINQLFGNILWGQKGNYLEIPTDCPQRDERLGWTGDANFFMRTAAYNFDVAPFFTKWLVDLMQDSQMKNGGFTHVAPALSYEDGGGTAWQDAAPICTWNIWQMYNDTRIIEQHYAALVRYMQYLHESSKEFIRNDKPFGDWLNLNAPTKSEVIGTAYYFHVAQIMSEMAGAIGRQEDAREFADLSHRIRDAFHKNFLNNDGSIKESSQTGYALAFSMNLIPVELRTKSSEKFVEEIKKKNWHLATGFIGTPRLLPALTDAGRSDVAYRLLLNEDFPSWLFQVKLGATTMWERWDGWRPDKGFQDPAMNSFNHYAFGSVGQWLYETCAGIEPAAPGFKKIRFQPMPGGNLTHAKSTFKSINGEIASSWRKTDRGMEYEFIVPPNTTATACLFAKDSAAITESERPVTTRREGDFAIFDLVSGHYRFTVRD